MTILYVSGLPRCSTLGAADLIARTIDSKDQNILLTGHLHLAASFARIPFGQHHSPLHLYDSREALIRSFIFLHQLPFSLDSYQAVHHHYFSGNGDQLNLKRLTEAIHHRNAFFIDPSFTHSIDPRLIQNLPETGIHSLLLVLWRNPIQFCLDLRDGVYSLDACLHWMLLDDSLSFPVDPLMLWLRYVRAHLSIIAEQPPSISAIIHAPRERVNSHFVSRICSDLSLSSLPHPSPSFLNQASWLLGECPFSGDPSFSLNNDSMTALNISCDQLSKFSNSDHAIQAVMELAPLIGYTLV